MTTTPSSERAEAASGPQRLHALSWLFEVAIHVRGLLLPAVLLIVTARWTNVDLLIAPAAVVIVAIALVRQWSLRYEITDTELVVRRNLLVHRSERHIPLTRVHNLRTLVTPVHEWLGVVEVAVETASGAEPEATLRVLSESALADLRARVAAHADARSPIAAHDVAERGEEVAPTVFAMSPRALVTWGLLNNRGLIIIGALAGLAWEINTSLQGDLPWDPRTWKGSYELVRTRARDLFGVATALSPVTLAGIGLAALAALKLLSVAWALVWLHRFRVTRSSSSVTIEHGLLPRTSTVVPFARIQQVVVRERPLLRAFGYVEIELLIAGGSADGNAKRPVWLAPLVARERVHNLLSEIGVDDPTADAPWQPLHPRAGRRMRIQMLIFLCVLALVMTPIAGWRVALAFLAVTVPLGLLSATKQARAMHYAVTGTHVLLKRGWLRRTLHLTWLDRVQVVALAASPFDRRHGMASVLVDTAAGNGPETRLAIPFLDAGIAQSVTRRLAIDAAATRFEW